MRKEKKPTFRVNSLNNRNNTNQEDISVYKINKANIEKFIQEEKEEIMNNEELKLKDSIM